jgi:hypothetical protein
LSDEFIKALINAQEMPEMPSDVAARIPDLLGGDSGQQALIRRIATDDSRGIPGAKQLDFTFQCARLRVGMEQTGFSNGQAEMTDIDESVRLKEIMDMSLRGEAIINKRETTFLKDGTVVIWVEWMEQKKRVPRKDREYLTEDELLSPAPSRAVDEDDDDEDDAEPSDPDFDAGDGDEED